MKETWRADLRSQERTVTETRLFLYDYQSFRWHVPRNRETRSKIPISSSIINARSLVTDYMNMYRVL